MSFITCIYRDGWRCDGGDGADGGGGDGAVMAMRYNTGCGGGGGRYD